MSKEVIGVVIIELFTLSNFTTSATLSKHMDSIKSSGLWMVIILVAVGR